MGARGQTALSLDIPAQAGADPAAALYPALAGELSALANLAEGLQAAVGALALEASAGAHRHDLQGLDLLTQRLNALALFCAAMPDVDKAIGGVVLADLARRLRGEAPAPAAPDEVELF